MLHALAAAAWLTMLLFFVSGRYRAPALPVLAAAAGYAVVWLWRRFRELGGSAPEERRAAARRLMLAGLALALLSALAHLPLLDGRHDLERQRLNSFQFR